MNNKTRKECYEKLDRHCQQKRSKRQQFISSDMIFFPFGNNNHWNLYVVINLRSLLNEEEEGKDGEKLRPCILHFEPFSPPPSFSDAGMGKIIRTICETMIKMDDAYKDLECNEDNLPGIYASGHTIQDDSWHCGTHTSMFIINMERHFDHKWVTTKTYNNPYRMGELITNMPCFHYHPKDMMDNLRTEIRTVYIRLLQIWAKKESRDKVLYQRKTFRNLYSASRQYKADEIKGTYTELLRHEKHRKSIQTSASSCIGYPIPSSNTTVPHDDNVSHIPPTTKKQPKKNYIPTVLINGDISLEKSGFVVFITLSNYGFHQLEIL
jgi:hypothetical protein